MYEFLNAKGEKVMLNARETAVARALEYEKAEFLNALGIDIPITTLTSAIKSVSEQKFYKVAPAEYLPVVVGEGAFSTNLLKYTSFNLGGDFEQGLVNTSTHNAQLAQADAGVEGVHIPVINWAKGLSWNLFEVQQAAKTGNWDLITEKEKARKTNWDLGIQKVAFLGLPTVGAQGLLNQSNVTSDTTTITKPIKSMDPTEFQAFVGAIYAAYRENSSYTSEPDTFVIPESDYNGLASATSAQFPLKSKLTFLKEAFAEIVGHNVEIKKLAYADAAQSGLGVQRYVLLRKDADTLALNIPVDYTATLANSINGYHWENAAYGQFTGVKVFRPKEVLYFDFTPSAS
jgi:hypothetical protein